MKNIYIDLLKDHLKKCAYEEVSCENDCGMNLQRWALADHLRSCCVLRKLNCGHCAVKVEQTQMEVIQFNSQILYVIFCSSTVGSLD